MFGENTQMIGILRSAETTKQPDAVAEALDHTCDATPRHRVSRMNHHVDSLILEMLTWSVRCITLEQLQSILTARLSQNVSAAHGVRRLLQSQQIETTPAVITVAEVASPLLTWRPGQDAPRYQKLAWPLEKRWKSVQPRRATLCWATEKGARRTAGIAGFSCRSVQMDHDLGTSAAYTRLWHTSPTVASGWIGEDILRRDYAPRERWLRKIPDAAIYREGRVQLVIEFGGQYSVERLRRFHEHCRDHRLPYQLW